jgi:glycosyltransferase involved in cell wall biosynthesis
MARAVCLITPAHVASNPRLVKEADALVGAGYDVTVVSGDVSADLRAFDEQILAAAAWKSVRVRRCLADRVLKRAATSGADWLSRFGMDVPLWLAVPAQHNQSRALVRAAKSVKADLYIAHIVSALPAAVAGARRHGGAAGYDIEDLHVEERAPPAGKPVDRILIRAIEAALVSSCRHLTASAPLIARAYEEMYGVKPVTVLNVFPLGLAHGIDRRVAAASSGELRAYWFSQQVGVDRGLQSFIEAMPLARCRLALDLRGANRFGRGDALMALAARLGVADRVRILPLAPAEHMVALAADYDIGLSFEQATPRNRDLCLTNKIFTYLLAGLPVLISDTSAHRAIAGELGAAAQTVSLSDPAAIARALDLWASQPELYADARTTAWRLARERFNWEHEKQLLLESVASAIGR